MSRDSGLTHAHSASSLGIELLTRSYWAELAILAMPIPLSENEPDKKEALNTLNKYDTLNRNCRLSWPTCVIDSNGLCHTIVTQDVSFDALQWVSMIMHVPLCVVFIRKDDLAIHHRLTHNRGPDAEANWQKILFETLT